MDIIPQLKSTHFAILCNNCTIRRALRLKAPVFGEFIRGNIPYTIDAPTECTVRTTYTNQLHNATALYAVLQL